MEPDATGSGAEMCTLLPCPRCVNSVIVSDEDPDGSLDDLWNHLGVHEPAKEPRTELFIWSQQNARQAPRRPGDDRRFIGRTVT